MVRRGAIQTYWNDCIIGPFRIKPALRRPCGASLIPSGITRAGTEIQGDQGMRWKGRRQSTNVEYRGSAGRGGRGARGMKIGGGGMVGVLVIAGIMMLLGQNPMSLLSQVVTTGGGAGGGTATSTGEVVDKNDPRVQFINVVLADTEEIWADEFQRLGRRYIEPELVYYRESVSSGCGMAGAETGPFYCPADQKIYIDLSFFDQLAGQLNAPGDFAQAYVVAHEVGHHVQNLLGDSDRLHSKRGLVSKAEYNRLSVKLELQADFYAGLWAHHAQKRFNILERGDVQEALGAAERSRRRPPPTARNRDRRSPHVHARNFSPTSGVVSARIRNRRHSTGRHLQ